MKTTEFNKEVLFSPDNILQIDASDIDELKKKAKKKEMRKGHC